MGMGIIGSGRYSAQFERIIEEQGGHITRGQLGALGLSPDAIKHLLARGYLRRVFWGVYAVGHIPTASLARAHAPLLAVGERSALAGWSAINLLQGAVRWVEPFTVITPRQASPAGIKVIHTSQLRTRDIRTVHGLRTVSPALAVLHVAPDLNRKALIRLIDDFRVDRRFSAEVTREELERTAARFPRLASPLRRVLEELQPEPTRSTWEQEWPPYAEFYDLPPYEMNVHVLTHRVDILFDGLIVMLDGWGVHGTRAAFEHDREEMAEIMATTGLPVLRITHRQFHQHPRVQADRITTIVARAQRAG
jgi:hypothetical protein